MTSRLHRALAASLAIHCLLSLIWLRRPPAPPEKIPVVVEYKAAPRAPSPRAKAGGSRSSGGSARETLGRFGVTPGRYAKSFGNRDFTDEGELGLGEEDFGSHGGRLEEIAHYNRFEKLFTHLQGMVDYPGKLGMRGIRDSVNARIYFDENSRCDWPRSRVGGSHPYFRIYVTALLKKLCALETVSRIGFEKGQFADINLNFVLLEGPEIDHPLGDFVQGNVLSYRRTFIHSHLHYRIGPLEGYFFAPVVSVNFPWIYEHWDQWVNGKDPLREFKD